MAPVAAAAAAVAGHTQVFKMTALRGLKLIFPADVNPLYAGFGNSVSDMVAYRKARERAL